MLKDSISVSEKDGVCVFESAWAVTSFLSPAKIRIEGGLRRENKTVKNRLEASAMPLFFQQAAQPSKVLNI